MDQKKWKGLQDTKGNRGRVARVGVVNLMFQYDWAQGTQTFGQASFWVCL